MSYVIGKDASREDEVIKDLVLEEAARDNGSSCLSPTAQMPSINQGHLPCVRPSLWGCWDKWGGAHSLTIRPIPRNKYDCKENKHCLSPHFIMATVVWPQYSNSPSFQYCDLWLAGFYTRGSLEGFTEEVPSH